MFDLVLEETTPYTLAGDGMTRVMMKKAPEYLDKIWRSAAKGFPSNVRYLEPGCLRVPPNEAARLIVRKFKNASVLDLAPTDCYFLRFELGFTPEDEDEELVYPVFFKVPYVRRGNRSRIKGVSRTLSPTMGDNVFSLSSRSLFVNVTKNNFHVERFTSSFFEGQTLRTCSCFWSKLHSKQVISKNIPKNLLALYFFSELGVTKTMARFGAEVLLKREEDLPEGGLPGWIACRTSGVRPVVSKEAYDVDIVLLIKESDLTASTRLMVASFFYLVDNYFPRMKNLDYLEDGYFWKTILGLIIHHDNAMGEVGLIEKIERHLWTVRQYVDIIIIEKLASDGIFIEDYLDLFQHIILTYQTRWVNPAPSSLYGKRLLVHETLLSNIVSDITNFLFSLQRGPLTRSSFEKALKRCRMDAFYDNRNKERPREDINIINTPSDSYVFEHSTKIVQSAKESGEAGGKLHVSLAEFCSVSCQPKSDPTGGSVINPRVLVTPDGALHRHEKFREFLDKTQLRLSKD